jgi:hypothetical protein
MMHGYKSTRHKRITKVCVSGQGLAYANILDFQAA